MGTRSDIIVHRADGTWARIYCHWDGYLEHNGRILFDQYTSQDQAEALVALGSLSKLGPEIGVKHPFDSPRPWTDATDAEHRRKYGKMCTAYGRDRGEKDVSADVGETLHAVWPPEDTWTEFTYVWDAGKWWVGDPDEGTQTLIDLGDALLGKKTLKPAVKAFGMVLGRHNAVDVKDGHSWSSRSD
ncbi:MAG TPA: hypothetical protein VLA00_15860 [Xanthobacteraceae bacterium]|nr:hypothetical protein [Xanthobacteraceae bacterium]